MLLASGVHSSKSVPAIIVRQEDTIADCFEFKAALPQGVATLELIHTNPQATKAFKLVTLSEGMAKDKAFARQAKRKFAWVALELGV